MCIKREKICLSGQSGSGKDHLLRGLVKMGLRYSPKITTRPQRRLERQGIDYDFVDSIEFQNLLESNKIKTYQHFLINNSDWFYAISCENFENNNIFIMTPHEISTLSKEDMSKCFVVYLDIDESIRRERITRRDDNNDSVERRIQSDKEDFKMFNEYDLKITDPEFECSDVYSLMM